MPLFKLTVAAAVHSVVRLPVVSKGFFVGKPDV